MTKHELKRLARLDERVFRKYTSTEEQFKKCFAQWINAGNSYRRDMWNRYQRIYFPDNERLETFLNFIGRNTEDYSMHGTKYTAEDYSITKQVLDLDIRLEVEQMLNTRGIKTGPFGEGKEVAIGDKVIICINFHSLKNKTGVVAAHRGHQYLVETDKNKIWCNKNEIRRIEK